jgi:hypothetical protein
MIILWLFPWILSLIGFGLVVSACYWARKPRAYFLVLVAAISLHGIASAISSQPFGVEPSHDEFTQAHATAILHFWLGLPFLVAPLVTKLLYDYFSSHKKSA